MLAKPRSWNVDPAFVSTAWRPYWRGMVFGLPMLEGAGPTRFYGLARGTSGALQGDAAWAVTPPVGRATTHDGSGDHFIVNVPSQASPATDRATMIVVGVADASSHNAYSAWMFSRGGTNPHGIAHTGAGTELAFSWDGVAGEYDAATGIGAYTVGVPYMMACSISPGGVLLLRINLLTHAVDKYTDANSNASNTITGDWYIGQDSFAATRCVAGKIGFAGLWSRDMTQSEILQLARDPWGPFRHYREVDALALRVPAGTTPVSQTMTASAEHTGPVSQSETASAEHTAAVTQLEQIATEHLLTEAFDWELSAEHVAAVVQTELASTEHTTPVEQSEEASAEHVEGIEQAEVIQTEHQAAAGVTKGVTIPTEHTAAVTAPLVMAAEHVATIEDALALATEHVLDLAASQGFSAEHVLGIETSVVMAEEHTAAVVATVTLSGGHILTAVILFPIASKTGPALYEPMIGKVTRA